MLNTYFLRALRRREALRLDADQYHDILALWRLRVIDIKARGRSISEIKADITNVFVKPLKVVISAGTCFRSIGSHQNMVARSEHVFRLGTGQTRYVTVPATCVNAERPIPGQSDRFRGVKKVPERVQRFLQESASESPMTVQAGVWSLTDGYSRDQIKSRLVTERSPGSTAQSISDVEISTAKKILDDLNIPNYLD